MKQPLENTWDVLVIGGGASGMMAAATAAGTGATVLLVEKNASLGKKLRITGGGRCNVTNHKTDNRVMLSMYRDKGKFLFSTFSQHNVSDTMSWFTDRGVSLKEENENRLFPTTDSADTIYEALLQELKKTSVEIVTHAPVVSITKEHDRFIIACATHRYAARACVIATGGTSRPETGSTGDGYAWAKQLGHTINSHNAALVPVLTKESWVQQVSGISVTDISLTILVDGVKKIKESGKVLFTHQGLSGPTILNLSKRIGDFLEEGTVVVSLDLFPLYDIGTLREKLTSLLQENTNKLLRNALSEILPTALGNALLRACALDGATPCHSVRAEDRKTLVHYLKAVPLTVTGLMGSDKAVISSGGVVLEEINFKSMESKIVPRLYLVGDMLDIDRPSGGYSLQLCWSTGYVAGLHASKTE